MIEKLPPEIVAVVLSIGLATARVMGDEKENKLVRVIIESVLCGCLSLTAHYAILALGMAESWTVFVAGVIGYLGSAFVKEIALKVIKKKTDKL